MEITHHKIPDFQFFTRSTHQEDSIGATSLITRNMYSIQVMSLNNKFAIRILKPANERLNKSIRELIGRV